MEFRELVKVGLTEGEAKVYLALLELGSSTVGPIVKRSGVAYSNIYEILERLIKKGLASFIVKSETKYFQAAGPENLRDYLEKQEKEIEEQKKLIEEFIPKLKLLQENIPEEQAEIFVGLKGAKAAYAKLIMGPKDDWRYFYAHKPEYAELADRFYLSVTQGLKIPKSIRGIVDEPTRKSKTIKAHKKYIQFRFVDFPVPANLDIYNDKVLIIAWSESPVTFLIKSQQVVSFMKDYFDSVWKVAKK